ncbi:MAG: metalloregulator ArsR/SmtB family transcription factor [Elusimicrobiales bacterium]|nr:metalloregulator ArsR/SmtB family transcription factor [Elusimicrobiales bacterium]
MATKKKTRETCEVLCEHPATVRLAKKELIPARQAQQAAELFKVLGDATRVKMLQILAKKELCVCDIAAVIEMSQSAVSHQLRVLRGARLVKYRRDGKMAWYSINDNHVAALLRQGVVHVRHK